MLVKVSLVSSNVALLKLDGKFNFRAGARTATLSDGCCVLTTTDTKPWPTATHAWNSYRTHYPSKLQLLSFRREEL
jgi:hypothetical protein